ncbi:MAG: PD-(D/E)XK nuclease family protein, partial [Clostridia bacterium]|nr:PD-(D/E)XK nuclease family protein [Clostridia bacterium]
TCPLAFYYRYVEHLYPQEEKETQFEDNTIGSFVHSVMEYIYTHFLHCDNIHPTRISPDAIEQIRTSEDKLNEALMAAYDAMNKEANSQEPRANSYIPEELLETEKSAVCFTAAGKTSNNSVNRILYNILPHSSDMVLVSAACAQLPLLSSNAWSITDEFEIKKC